MKVMGPGTCTAELAEESTPGRENASEGGGGGGGGAAAGGAPMRPL